MPRRPRIPDDLRYRPFRGADVIAAGLVTRRRLAGPGWRRLFTDVYMRADAPVDHLTWCCAAALLVPDGGALSDRSAATLYCAPASPPLDCPIEVTVPPRARLRGRSNLLVRRTTLVGGDVRRLGGLPVTTPARTAFDLARRQPLVEAVCAVDALLYRRVLRLEDLTTYAAEPSRLRLPRARAAARVFGLVRPQTESPMETRLRLLLVQAGLPEPTVQPVVFDHAGNFVARLDLGYEELKVGVEYDGDHHRERAVFRRDAVRLNRLRLCGWTVLRFTADDVLRNPQRVVAQVRTALIMTARGRRRS